MRHAFIGFSAPLAKKRVLGRTLRVIARVRHQDKPVRPWAE
jgi:hypothetical protein